MLRPVAALALVGGLAACGTTAPLSSTVSQGGSASQEGLDTPAGGGGELGSSVGGAPVSGTTGRTSSTSPGGAAGGTGPQPGTALSNAPATSVKVRGVTDKTITIGVFYASDGKEAVGALGGSADRGNEKLAYQALFEDLNARGGIAGRKVVPVWYELDFGDQRPRDVQEQPACEHFTQDNAVFAVLTTKAGGATDTFKACLEKAGVVHIAGNFTVAGSTTYRQFPHYVEPDGMAIERSAAAVPPSLAERSWLSGWNATTGRPATGKAAIGVVTADYPTFTQAVDRVLLPAFRAVGGDVKQVVRVSMTDTGAATSAISNAVLSFRRQGVTHVSFLQSAGATPLLFLQQASNQGYYPRYAFTSQDVMPLLHEARLVPNASRSFNGAMGVGWWPSADTTYGRSSYSRTPAAKDCVARHARKQQAPTNALQETLAYFHCDVLTTLKQGIEAGGPVITPGSFLRGLDRLASPFGAAGTVRSVLRTAKRDGASAIRGFAWQGDCSCFVHQGPQRTVR